MTTKRLSAVFIDLSGTLHIEDTATAGAIAAVSRLQRRPDIVIKFVTNTTKESKKCLLSRLQRCGFKNIKVDQIFTSLSATRRYIDCHQLKPMLMLEPEALEDFEGCDCSEPQNAVVMGLAPSMFNFQSMNRAFKLLLRDDSQLIAIHKGRYYKRNDGLALSLGPFVQALEFATSKVAHVVGKPSKDFYNEALALLKQDTSADFKSQDVWMIGDDVLDDVCGALNANFNAILVKTGKYKEGDEQQVPKEKRIVHDTFAKAVDYLLERFDALPSIINMDSSR